MRRIRHRGISRVFTNAFALAESYFRSRADWNCWMTMLCREQWRKLHNFEITACVGHCGVCPVLGEVILLEVGLAGVSIDECVDRNLR